MSDYKRRNINLDKLSSYVLKTGICTEETALHLMDEIMFLRAEVREAKDLIGGEHGLEERLIAADAGWSEWQIKARQYEVELKRIATFYDDGESDFSGDTPTSIAKAALEI